jgi:putative metallohydrolase (TIGR04338 family)
VSRREQLAVYAAEEAALADRGRVFARLAEAQHYADVLVARDWWIDRWPAVDRVVVRPSRSRHWAGYAITGANEIRLSTRREPVLLHELAHLVTPGVGHGDAFVSALLALVRERMGFHAYGALLHELRGRSTVVGDPRPPLGITRSCHGAGPA